MYEFRARVRFGLGVRIGVIGMRVRVDVGVRVWVLQSLCRRDVSHLHELSRARCLA